MAPFVGPQTDTGKPIHENAFAYPVVGPNGLIYLAFETNFSNWKLVAISGSGAVELQTATYPGASPSTPTIADDGSIYVDAANFAGGSDFYAFNPDASFKWKISGPAFGQSVTLGPDGTVYVPLFGGFPVQGKLLALNPDGSSKWTYDYGGLQEFNAPAVAPNGDLVVTGMDSGFRPFAAAHRSTDGGQLWSLTYPTLPAPGAISPPSVAPDGTTYFWTHSSALLLWAVTPTGQLKWPFLYLLSDGAASTPAMAPDGSIRVATSGGSTPVAPRLLSISSAGQINWMADLGAQGPTLQPQVAVDANGTSYVSLNGGPLNCPSYPCATAPVLFAANSDGSLVWDHQALAANTDVIGSAGALYAVLLDNAPAPQYAVWRLYEFGSEGSCAVHSVTLDTSLSGGVVSARKDGSGCQVTITITNMKRFWVNLSVAATGTATACPVGGDANLSAKYKVLAPGSSLSYIVRFSRPDESLIIRADETLESGPAGPIMSATTAVLDAFLPSPVNLVVDNYPRVADAFTRMPDLQQFLNDFFQPPVHFSRAFQDLLAFARSPDEFSIFRRMVQDLFADVTLAAAKEYFSKLFKVVDALVSVFGLVWEPFFSYPAGSVVLVAD